MTDFDPGVIEMDPVDKFDDFADREVEETSFGGGGEMPDVPTETEIPQAENQIAKDDFYRHLVELGWNVDKNAALGKRTREQNTFTPSTGMHMAHR